MEDIPFTKVSIDDAKVAMQTGIVPVTTVPPASAAEQRRAEEPHDLTLSSTASEWLAALPDNVRPHALVHSYPRIANKLSEAWHLPLHCERYLDELMWDKRGGRAGFPAKVAGEIAALTEHFQRTRGVARFDLWGNRIEVTD